jgi:hypothetical protein
LVSCIIHILNTGVLKFKRKFWRLKVNSTFLAHHDVFCQANYLASLSKGRQSLKKGRIYLCYDDSSGTRGGAVA